jgi:hypothetical protein
MVSNQPPAARIAAQFGAALMFVCLVCSACGAESSASSGPTATAQPTMTNTPSGPPKVNGPYLGGTESNFQAAFGAPTLNASQSRHYETTINGTHVLIVALLGAGGVTDRMRFLRIAPDDQGVTWNASTGEAMVKQFLPPDSKYQKDKKSQNVGTEHVYLSQLLAASFPASVFTDIDTDAPLPPGTFDYYCGGDVNADGGCALLLGA